MPICIRESYRNRFSIDMKNKESIAVLGTTWSLPSNINNKGHFDEHFNRFRRFSVNH